METAAENYVLDVVGCPVNAPGAGGPFDPD